MAKRDNDPDMHGGRMRVPRSRGALSGTLLLIAGVWGALIPFVGPIFGFGFTPDSSFDMTLGRFWLELVPGVVAAVGGFLLLVAANRVVTSFGAWLGVAGGAWFLIGPALAKLLHLGGIGHPIHSSTGLSTLESLLFFDGIGALILFLGAVAVGRLGVVSVRDVRAAQKRERADEAEERAARQRRSDDEYLMERRSGRHSGSSNSDGVADVVDSPGSPGAPTSPTPRQVNDPEHR